MPSTILNKYKLIKEISSNASIKTYLARLEPIIKVITPKDKDDYHGISERLEQLKDQLDIYEIIEEDNKFYIVAENNEKLLSKIDKLILSNESATKKEGIIKGHGSPVTKKEKIKEIELKIENQEEYEIKGEKEEKVIKDGKKIETVKDKDGNVIKEVIIEKDGSKKEIKRDEDGNIIEKITDKEGKVKEIIKDENGEIIREIKEFIEEGIQTKEEVIIKKVKDFNISEVKQKGVDMFEHFIFGEKKEEDNKDEELEEENDNNIINEINTEKNINDNNNDKRKNEFNKIFGVEAKKDNKENIIIKNSDINKTEKEKEESKKENIIENIKLMRENAEIKALLEDMKNKNLDYLGMIKDREDLISEYTNQSKKSKVNEELNDDDNNKITKIDLIYNEPLIDMTNEKEIIDDIKLFNKQNKINSNEKEIKTKTITKVERIKEPKNINVNIKNKRGY